MQLPRLYIYMNDFRQSRRFAGHILDKRLHDKKSEQSKLVHQAFNTSLIISYARPFGTNRNFEGQGKSSLKKYVTDVLNEDEIELHNRVIAMRDTTYAHSDARSHLIEGFDYSKYAAIMMLIQPLDKSSTSKLKTMIDKWIKYLEAEKSKLKGATRSTSYST